jgi:hypothetical protein
MVQFSNEKLLALGGLLSLGQERLSLLLSENALGDVVMRHNGEDCPAVLQARNPKLKPALLVWRVARVLEGELGLARQNSPDPVGGGAGTAALDAGHTVAQVEIVRADAMIRSVRRAPRSPGRRGRPWPGASSTSRAAISG